MKITKAMGRACLRELETGEYEQEATQAIHELSGGGGSQYPTKRVELLLLAMCAAIAGVRPESEGD